MSCCQPFINNLLSDLMPIITCQQRINNVIQILKSNYMLPIREFIGKEYVGRSGWMIGVVDDGTLILELYQLNSMLSEHGQTDSEHPQPPNHLCGLYTHYCGTLSINPWLLPIDWSWWSQARLRESYQCLQQWISSIVTLWQGRDSDLIMMVPLLSVNQIVVRLPCNHLQTINSGYSGIQYPTVSKDVIVYAHNNPWWGHVGIVKNHNFIFNMHSPWPSSLSMLKNCGSGKFCFKWSTNSLHTILSTGGGQHTCVNHHLSWWPSPLPYQHLNIYCSHQPLCPMALPWRWFCLDSMWWLVRHLFESLHR